MKRNQQSLSQKEAGQRGRRRPLLPALALVPRSGFGDDPDFAERFRRERVKRWRTGLRNGIGFGSVVRYRLGLREDIAFHGEPVHALNFNVTIRAIEDIWMAGIYDYPGYVPEPGWRVVDIGANVGIFSMLAASRGARVVSYEPYGLAFEMLRKNTSRWNVECHHSAVVGARRETVQLFVHDSRDNRNTILSSEAEGLGGSVEVPAVCLADVLAEPCDLLKIDCEGAEFEFVSAVPEALGNARRLVIEVHGSAGDPADFADRIRDAGFSTFLHDAYPGTDFHMLTATNTGKSAVSRSHIALS